MESATGTSSASSTGGNMLNQISNSASGSVTVIYHYIPDNSLRPGDYTIIQNPPPPGYVHGRNTAGNVTPLPGSAGTDYIHLTLNPGANLKNNDFGELRPVAVTNARPPVFARLSKANFLSLPGGHGVMHARAHPRRHHPRRHVPVFPVFFV
jgi:hypothetical protein